MDKNPKILGVTFDPHLHFHAHVQRKVKEGRQKLRILRSLAGASWGCSKETLLRTYKSHVESSLFYASPIWGPNISASSANQLQRIVNAAARISTGCHSSTPVSDLLMEAQILPAEARIDMLSQQSLASALRPNHPSHVVVTAPPGPRHMKDTLHSKHIAAISPLLSNGTTDPATYRATLKTIHTESVSRVADDPNYNFSRILGGTRPYISPSESSLSRAERSTLAQLRSGQCHLLQDYQLRIGKSTSAVCPECRYRRHTVNHLFTCDARPTNLSTRDLWVNPITTVEFLRTLPSFSSLATIDAVPAPRPPPEPPP